MRRRGGSTAPFWLSGFNHQALHEQREPFALLIGPSLSGRIGEPAKVRAQAQADQPG